MENNKDILKGKMAEFLSMHNLSTRTPFVCVNPAHIHRNNTPSMSYNPAKGNVHCFGSCNSDFDVFDLVGFLYGLNSFPEKIAKLEELFDLDPSFDGNKDVQKQKLSFIGPQILKESGALATLIGQYEGQELPNRTIQINSGLVYIREAGDYLASRGINLKLARDYFIGYWPSHDMHGTKCKVLVLPCDNFHYSLRVIGTCDGSQYAGRYEKRGKGPAIFAADNILKACKDGKSSLLYVTEGEMDALSIITVGGYAVALRGKDDTVLYPYLDAAVKLTGNKPVVIAACDNDEPGWQVNNTLNKTLRQKGFTVHYLNIYDGHKDPNEALTADRERFVDYISRSMTPVGLESLLRCDAYYSKNTTLKVSENVYLGKKVVKRFSTGFVSLDKVLDGGLGPFLYILGAKAAMGKTSLALQMADYIASSGNDVLYFAYEMSKELLVSKSLSRLMYVACRGDKCGHAYAHSFSDIYDHKVRGAKAQEMLDIAYKTYHSSIGKHMIIIDEQLDINGICSAIQVHKENTGVSPVIFIDYLQIVPPSNPNIGSSKQAVDEIITRLSKIASYYNVPVVMISSYNRTMYSKREADFGSFNQSSLIEYQAYCLMSFQLCGQGTDDFDEKKALRHEPRFVEIQLLKNRGGRLGKVQFAFVTPYSYIREFVSTEEHDEQYNELENEQTLTEFEKLVDDMSNEKDTTPDSKVLDGTENKTENKNVDNVVPVYKN
ncbi:MAG: toprim domain-containing protein [Alphaproteobacteria bacterium]|nr:toprim domain-containing protein [Alphaproteobacteria bacterium]